MISSLMVIQPFKKCLFSFVSAASNLNLTHFDCCSSVINVGRDGQIKKFKVDSETLDLVKKMSLVDFSTEREIGTLESAIEFADQLMAVTVPDDVKPMYSVQENCSLLLRNDIVSEGNYQKHLIKLASKTEEEYFVAPPGNMPTEP